MLVFEYIRLAIPLKRQSFGHPSPTVTEARLAKHWFVAAAFGMIFI
jgi:hypothetical protein